MSGINSVAPAEARLPIEPHEPLDQDKRPPRRPRKPHLDDDMVEMPAHQLDLEA